jgi:hypothetical protein
MKQLHIAGNLLKTLVLAGLLTACHNDQTIAPTETSGVERNDQSAKISPLLRLVKEGERTIQYLKTGKFAGKVSKVDYGSSSNYYATYGYDDNNPAGDLWISKKLFNKAGNSFVQEWKYKVSNGVCVLSQDLVQAYSYQYLYNGQGQLDEVKLIINGGVSAKLKYSYNFNAATNTYRLNKIVETSTNFGPNIEFTFEYSPLPDNYSLNFSIYNIDKYLPIFGKSSDVLVEKRVEKSLANPANPAQNYNHTYTVDSDGLVILRKVEKTFGNTSPSGSGTAEALKYSTSWQGI